MIARFSGQEGRSAVIEALLTSKLICGDRDMAEAVTEAGEPVVLNVGEPLIVEDAEDTDLYFIVAGAVAIQVKGVRVNERGPGDHVGEIAALDPTQRRSATVIVEKPGVAWKVPEPALTAIAKSYPAIWRRLAIEQAHRLVQRNALVRPANDVPLVFVISSVEALEAAREIQTGLTHADMLVTLWTDGVFRASDYAIPALQRVIDESDFAVVVIEGDDTVQSRGTTSFAPRDNVTFELGLFMGKLGLERTILVEQRGSEVKLASDLRGITTLSYPPGPADKLTARMGPVFNEISKHVRRVGVRK